MMPRAGAAAQGRGTGGDRKPAGHTPRVLQAITRMMVGGAQLTALQTAERLSRTDYRCELLTGPQTGPEGDLLSVARDVVPTTILPTLVREVHPWHDARALKDARRFLASQGRLGDPFQVVHTHVSKAGAIVRQAARSVHTPVIVHTAHGWQWTNPSQGVLNRIMVATERWAARFTDLILVVSEQDREKGLAAGVGIPTQYRLVESAIDLEAFDPSRVRGTTVRNELAIPHGVPVVGTVGRFAYPKEPEVMLEAARRLLAAHSSLHFVYAGHGPDRERVLARFPDLVAHPRMHLPGLRRDVPELLALLDVFLLSSTLEGLARTVVEALAMGIPVVSTPAGGVPEVVIDSVTGRLVPFADPEALAQATLALLDAPEVAAAWGAEGSRRVRLRFDVNRMVAAIEDIYRELLARKGLDRSR